MSSAPPSRVVEVCVFTVGLIALSTPAFAAGRPLAALSVAGTALAQPGLDDCDGDGRSDATELRTRLELGAADLLLARAAWSEPSGSTRDVVAIDVDHDGDVDLLTANAERGHVGLLENRSRRGAIEVIEVLRVPVSEQPDVVIAVDIDRDGDDDLLASARAPARVEVLANVGGSFEARDPLIPPASVADVAVADIDGDGVVDVAVADFNAESISVFRGALEGAFAVGRNWAAGGGPAALEVADLDGDGVLDIVAGVSSRRRDAIAVLRGVGGGAFATPESSFAVPGSDFRRIAVADLDGDGHRDLAAVSRSGHSVAVFHGLGGGRFRAAELVLDDSKQGRLLGAADLDADGDLDLLVGSWCVFPFVRILVNHGDATFAEGPSIEHALCGDSIASADVDGDGDIDLIARAPEDRLALFERASDGTYTRTDLLTLGETGEFHALADFDGDGLADVLATDSTGRAVLSRGFGSSAGGRFDAPRGIATVGHYASLRAGDFDGDGVPDDCEAPRFHRGDVDGDGRLSIHDAVFVFGFLFGGVALPRCLDAVDVDDDGAIRLTDGMRILAHLFLGGPAPALPGGAGGACGVDGDPRVVEGTLGCDEYAPCARR